MADAVEVGSEVLAYCTSCKMDLNHIVASMKGDKLAKVECLTCKKTHAWKAPKGVTEPKKSKRKTAEEVTADAARAVEVEWQRLMAAKSDVKSTKYSSKTSFILGDKLGHPTFGDGIVGKIIYPNKIEVIFKSDVKILIHGGAPVELPKLTG